MIDFLIYRDDMNKVICSFTSHYFSVILYGFLSFTFPNQANKTTRTAELK